MAYTQFQHRRDTAANWLSNNPILAEGEIGFATDVRLVKIGDGVTPWNDLSTTGLHAQALETITVHLSDNITPVQAQATIEKLTLRYNFTLEKVWFETAYQAPTGANAIVRVLNGTTNIFTSADALTITAGNSSVGPLIPDTTYHPAGSVLNFDITQVGATNTGLGYRVTLQGVRS